MSFRPFIEKWHTKAALAADLGTKQGVVQQWWNRDSIPAPWFPRMAKAAKARRIHGVTEEGLARAAAKRRFPPVSRRPREAVGV